LGADVGHDEEADTATESPAFLHGLIHEDDDDPGEHELDEYENSTSDGELCPQLSVSACPDVGEGLKGGHEDGKYFLGSGVE
jgi:hypothetical protein